MPARAKTGKGKKPKPTKASTPKKAKAQKSKAPKSKAPKSPKKGKHYGAKFNNSQSDVQMPHPLLNTHPPLRSHTPPNHNNSKQWHGGAI